MISESVMARIKKLRSMSYRVETEEECGTLRYVDIYIGESCYRIENLDCGRVNLAGNISSTDTDKVLVVAYYVFDRTQNTYTGIETALDDVIGCLARPYDDVLGLMVGEYIADSFRMEIESDPVYYSGYQHGNRMVANTLRYSTISIIREYARSLL